MPFENLVFRPQSRGGQIPPPATATATATAQPQPQPQPQPPPLAVAVAVAAAAAVAMGDLAPLGIEVEKQGFRTAWLITGQKFP